MRKLIIIFFFFANSVYAETSDLSKAIELISYNKHDEAYVQLQKILRIKGQPEIRLKALLLLLSYPIGSTAYLNRETYAQEIFKSKNYWEMIGEDQKRTVLFTFGRGSFSKKNWKNAEVAYSKLSELTKDKLQDEYSLAQSYLGWISINKNEGESAVTRWCNLFNKNSIHEDWKSIMAKDLGAIWVEVLYSEKSKGFNANNKCILAIMQGENKESFRDGFILGFQRTNQVFDKMVLIAKGLKSEIEFQNFYIESDFSFKELAEAHPCYFLDVISDKFKIPSKLNDLLIKRFEKCWPVIEDKQISMFTAVTKNVSNLPGKINAELNERNGNYDLACIEAIKLQEKTLAIRSCTNWLKLSKNKQEIAGEIKESLGQLVWPELWGQIFQVQHDDALKFKWLNKHFKDIKTTYKYSESENERRPILWLIELCSSENEDCGDWKNEILNGRSQLWSIANLKCNSKYSQILTQSLRHKRYNALSDDINDIEKCLKNDKDLKMLYFTWLDSYWSEINDNLTISSQSKYFSEWQSAKLVIGQNIKMNIADLKLNLKILHQESNLPGVAKIIGLSSELIKQSLNVTVNLDSPYFVNQLTKKITLLKKGIDQLQKKSSKLSQYQKEVENLRQNSLREIITSIEELSAAKNWKNTEIELWENQKQKIIASLKESL